MYMIEILILNVRKTYLKIRFQEIYNDIEPTAPYLPLYVSQLTPSLTNIRKVKNMWKSAASFEKMSILHLHLN